MLRLTTEQASQNISPIASQIHKLIVTDSRPIPSLNLYPTNPLVGFLLVISIVTTTLLFIQALYIPYWQDDYYFLINAQQARTVSDSWFTVFWSKQSATFWRPLGMDFYWRFIESTLNANVRAAHVSNLILHFASAISVAWFVTRLQHLMHPGTNRWHLGLLIATLYGVHAANFLPVVWVSAANSSLVVIFSALSLGCWLQALYAPSKVRETIAVIGSIVFFTFALFCREIAIIIPALGTLLSALVWPKRIRTVTAFIAAGCCVLIAIAWLIARGNIVTGVDDAYSLRFGSNVLRNCVSLALFFFNTPREALRFILTDPSPGIIAWAFSCFALQFAACLFFLKAAWNNLTQKTLIVLSLFLVVACGPYLLLNENSYAYYVAMSLLVYVIVIALGFQRTKLIMLGTGLAVISAALSWSGNQLLEYPSLLGRAEWVENQLLLLESECREQGSPCRESIALDIRNEHKFLGFGYAGLAYRVGLKVEEFPVVDQAATTDSVERQYPTLIIPDQGDVYFETN